MKVTASTLAALLISATTSTAATVDLGAEADTYVRVGASADTNFGSEDLLKLKSQGSVEAGFRRFGLLKFDLNSISETIADATLSLSLGFNSTEDSTSTSKTVQLYGIADSVGDDWVETVVTFNNYSGVSITGFGSPTATLLGSVTVDDTATVGETFSFNSAALTSFLSSSGPDGLVTLGLQQESTIDSDTVEFWSKDYSNASLRPGLSVTSSMTPVPLPAAGWLLLGAVGGLAALRRRKT